jgi:hypothetical protein
MSTGMTTGMTAGVSTGRTTRASAWDELVTAALLGTGRRPLPTDLPEPVGRLARAQADRAPALLDAAAGYAAYRHAGARPGSAPQPPPAPRQELDLASRAAERLLVTLLSGADPALVDEWLRTCVSRALGVRPGLWAALATASASPSGPDRALVGAALGQRGRAFLAMNPRWRAVPGTSSTAGAPPLPGLADRGWSARLTEEALDLVRVSGSPGRHEVVVGGDRRRLRRAVGGADLDVWQRHTGLAPGPLLEVLRAGAGERLDDVVGALADAAVAQRHAGWAEALVRAGHAGSAGHAGHARQGLARLVAADAWDGIARDWVAGHGPDRAALLLTMVPAPWADGVADTALRLLASGRTSPAAGRRLVPVLARRAPLTVRPLVGRLADQERAGSDTCSTRGLADAQHVLAVRAEIERTFDTPEETP